MCTLYELEIGKLARVHSFNKSYELSSRLSEMGIISGVIIRVIKKNPFGGPIELKLNNNYIAIRKQDAKMINMLII